ncbi:gliding motility-associated C-terminal domain-containing protein [Lutibacter oricola]|uniref:Gliding motility-associated C-terminal domain-containing protein n=1 Tax=Lutibacter oricola TaxID=762486 RepID=A0A1H3ACA2_9FLAO|nr:T9SS type B sorting domain-containing protein [Lutibacter oricola]SDX27347.1 gliding motility-associated C-terminal domain-containing protein [Lutibacter oricola]
MKRIPLYLLILIHFISFSQNEAAIWYFGEFAGLDFNSGAPVVLTDGQLNTFEGCATISDYQGNLLFYTDGVTVWDTNHAIMPNGTGLLGNTSSTQSAIIVPKPNNANQYYIFTVDDRGGFSPFSFNGINYSTVDLTLNGGTGDIISSEKNINVIGQAYEKITAVKHADNNSFWVISFIQDQFYSWRVDATGVNLTPVISAASNSSDSRGYLKVSPDGTKIACANFGGNHSIKLYDFNSTTGIVSNENILALDSPDDIPYGVEFSAQSRKLYVTTNQQNGIQQTTPSKLFQYNLLAANVSTSRVLIHTSNVNTRGAVQLAIDGKIYRALSITQSSQTGTPFLGIINNPEADGLACNYVHNALDISAGDPNRNVVEGLPPFIQSFFLTNITANNVCFGSTTEFNLSSTTPPDSIVWDFGDPTSGVDNTSTIENPNHTFTSTGTFTVTAVITIGFEVETITLEITIYDLPIVNSPVTLIQCDDDLDGFTNFNLEEANSLISTASPTPTITYFLNEADALANTNIITNPTNFSNNPNSIVWARVVNETNCIATAEVNLQVTSTQIPTSLMYTFNECDDDTDGVLTFDFSSTTAQLLTDLLPATNLTVSYYETVADALAETNTIDETNYTTTTPNSQQIVVRVDDLNNGCFGLGFHVTLNVVQIPEFDLASTIEFCDNDIDKIIGIENPVATYNYVWLNNVNTTISTTESAAINTSGTYTVIATDPLGLNCETTKTIDVTINNAPIINSPITLIQCDDDLDGIVDFNLEEVIVNITSETPLPTITFFTSEANATSNTNSITNSTAFSNSTISTVWARVENTSNCFSVAQVDLQVAATDIPDDLIITFNECDDTQIDNDDTNGIKTFDFSSATNQVLNTLPTNTSYTVTYYEDITNALAETNAINPSNYRNTTPFTQQIVVRVDDVANNCFGLGFHVTLNVEPAPDFDLDSEITLCLTSENSIINIKNPAHNYLYEWFNEANELVGTEAELKVSSVGNYSVTARKISGSNCISTKTIQVNSQPIDLLTEFNDDNLEIINNTSSNSITILTNTLPNGVFEFSLDNGIFQTTNTFNNVIGGEHIITIKDIENCTEAQLTIFLISIPNFFTPNNDGYNDTWHIPGIEFQPNSNIYIFDRFGKLIKLLKPNDTGWDGYYNGNPLPSTDYWYKIELENGNILKGHFSLIRR